MLNSKPVNKPINIVWLVAGHQPYGNRPAVAHKLPLQKRLAETGIRFVNARTVLPVCSPARASMLTWGVSARTRVNRE